MYQVFNSEIPSKLNGKPRKGIMIYFETDNGVEKFEHELIDAKEGELLEEHIAKILRGTNWISKEYEDNIPKTFFIEGFYKDRKFGKPNIQTEEEFPYGSGKPVTRGKYTLRATKGLEEVFVRYIAGKN